MFSLQISSFSFDNLALGDCPPGWSLNGENCYYIETRKVKYNEAKAGCEAFGAKLTSIHSAEEQSYHSSKCSVKLRMCDNEWSFELYLEMGNPDVCLFACFFFSVSCLCKNKRNKAR